MSKPIYNLNNWYISELAYGSVCGEVSNNPNFKNGENIHTSKVIGWDEENQAVETLNSKYILEEPDPDYEKTFPNAKERFINQLKKDEK